MTTLLGRTDNKTILFINPWWGIIGPNTGLRQLALTAMARGHTVHCVCPEIDAAAEQLRQQGVVLHLMRDLEKLPRAGNWLRMLSHLRKDWSVAARIAEVARECRADVICINSENMPLAPRAGRLAGAPVVVITRGMRFTSLGWRGNAYFGLQQRWVNRYISITKSGTMALQKMGVPKEKILCIPNGVDTRLFCPRPRSAELAREFGVLPEDLVIGALSHMLPHKGLHHLIEAIGLLAPRLPNLKVLAVGGNTNEEEARYERQLHDRVAQLHLADRVFFPGYRRDVADLLTLMDVVVHPSETEACPRAVIEAQASGKPVVGFAVDGMPEVVENAVTGILVPPLDVVALAQAAEALLTNEPRRRQMGLQARERARLRFDLNVNLSMLVDELLRMAGALPQNASSRAAIESGGMI
jgi:glycosyltransferase involved in cell wall biosynthesis